MPWTATQIRAVVQRHAHEGEARCPTCHIPLAIHAEHIPRYTRPVPILRCRRCGEQTELVVPLGDAPASPTPF